PASTYGRASRLSDVYWTPNPNSSWGDNRPSQADVDAIFGVPGGNRSGPFFINSDNTLYQDRGALADRYSGPFMVDENCAIALNAAYAPGSCATGDLAYRYFDNSATPVLRENPLGTMFSNPLERYTAF